MFHENAKREIADTYADMGEIEKAYKLYEGYLESDPLSNQMIRIDGYPEAFFDFLKNIVYN